MTTLGAVFEWVASRECSTPDDAKIQRELLEYLNDLHQQGIITGDIR